MVIAAARRALLRLALLLLWLGGAAMLPKAWAAAARVHLAALPASVIALGERTALPLAAACAVAVATRAIAALLLTRWARRLGAQAAWQFAIRGCQACAADTFIVVDASAGSRAVRCVCRFCHRSQLAKALAADAPGARPFWKQLRRFHQLRSLPLIGPRSIVLVATTRADVYLPYENTSREHIPEALRRVVYARAQGCCEHHDARGIRCGSREQKELDHIIPIKEGGATTALNLQVLCRHHNRQKGARC